MNPRHLKEVREAARRLTAANSDVLSDRTNEVFSQQQMQPPGGNLFHKVGGEFDKLVASIGQVFRGRTAAMKVQVRGGSDDSLVAGSQVDIVDDAMEEFVSQEIWKDANEQITNYLGIVQPLLKDLAGVFDELNMDDPTKV